MTSRWRSVKLEKRLLWGVGVIFRNGRFFVVSRLDKNIGNRQNSLIHLHFPTPFYCFLKNCPGFVFGPHQKWCEMLRKNGFIPRGSHYLWCDPKSEIQNPKCLFASGPHQKWCGILRKNVLSCMVHAISGVIRNLESIMQNAFIKMKHNTCLV